MIDYGKFRYLDLQKTGSTFISQMLKECSLLPVVKEHSHLGIRDGNALDLVKLFASGRFNQALSRNGVYRKHTIYFNSIRNPLSYYASLYNFGCDGKGSLCHRLQEQGFGSLYQKSEAGFFKWLSFVLDPETSKHVSASYAKCGAEYYGFLTFRFLSFSMPNPRAKLTNVQSLDHAKATLERENIVSFTARNEALESDLMALIDTQLSDYISREKALAFFQRGKLNASKANYASAKQLADSALGSLVKQRDILIFEKFYQDAL